MKIEFKTGSVLVTREKGDKAFYGDMNAAGESALFYAIKQKLNKEGYDLIKKRMWKDGHLVDDMQQYIKTRKPSGDPDKDIYIYNTFFAVEGANDMYNKGSVSLGLVRGIFDEKTEEVKV